MVKDHGKKRGHLRIVDPDRAIVADQQAVTAIPEAIADGPAVTAEQAVRAADNRPEMRGKALAFIRWADGCRTVVPVEDQRRIADGLEVALAYLGETDGPDATDAGPVLLRAAEQAVAEAAERYRLASDDAHGLVDGSFYCELADAVDALRDLRARNGGGK